MFNVRSLQISASRQAVTNLTREVNESAAPSLMDVDNPGMTIWSARIKKAGLTDDLPEQEDEANLHLLLHRISHAYPQFKGIVP